MINNLKNKKGFTLIELLVSLFVIMVIMLGIYSLIIISLKLNSDNAFFIEATEIANQKMEIIRNLSYDDVGLTTGFPAGVILQDETINRTGTYNIHTSVLYYDDPYDGEAGSGDTVFTDYKIVTIKVSWTGKFKERSISIFSKIISATEETTTGYGLLKISVVDSGGAPVPNADIQIINPAESINMTITADTSGKLSVPLPPGFENYEIIVTKTNYGVDKTHERNAVNLNPTKPHISIFDGLKTEESFSIDKLSLLTIKTLSNTLPNNWNVNPIATTTSNSKISASSDNSDNIYIAWQNSASATSTVFVQKFDSSDTAQWSNPKEISDTSYQKNPDITTTSNGNSFIVWQDNSTVLKATAYKPKNNLVFKPKNIPKINSSFTFFPLPEIYYFSSPKILSKNHTKFPISIKDFKTKTALAAGGIVNFVAMSSGSTNTSRSITLSTPTGVIQDDLLIAYIEHDDASDGPVIAPSGWNILDNNLNPLGWYSDSRGGLFWKFASASESATHYFYLTYNVNEEKAGHIRAYRGVDKANPFDGSLARTQTPYDNQYHTAPSTSVNNDGSMLVCGWGSDTYTLGNVSGGPIFPATMSNAIDTFAPYVTAATADMPVNISDSPTPSMTYDANQNVTHASIDWCFVLKPEIIPDDVTTDSIGTQTVSLVSPSADNYLGGAFTFSDNSTTKDVSGITISENGTIDASLDLANVKLFYDIDSSPPYDCQSESFDAGLDSQFGSNTSFDSSDGEASFTASPAITIGPTASLCVYPVLDINSSADSGETIDFFINNPSTDITIDSGTVIPNTSVSISGSTSILKPAILTQVHYRIRNDDGDENTATWSKYQDTAVTAKTSDYLRFRIEISNTGDLSSNPTNYTLEYAQKISTCQAIVSWNNIPTDTSAHWQIYNSSYITDNATSTNISDGLTDENTNFHTGYLKDSSNQTTALSLTSDEFTEIEFTIKATTNANNSDYCFRLTNNNIDTDFEYLVYPQITVTGDDNIYIQGIDNNGVDLWSVKKINSDTGDADQRLPKIASTEKLGVATTVIAWEDNRDGNYNIYANSVDANRNKLWASDLQITSSSTDENSIDIIFDSNHHFIITWVDNSSGNNEIYLDKFNLDGVELWSSKINITNSVSDEYRPQLSIDSSDNIYVTYYENNSGIYNSKIIQLDSSGNQNWQTNVNTSDSDYNQFSPSVTLSGSYLYASWTDTRKGDNDIYTQKFNLSGTAQWTSDQRINVNNGTTDQNSSFIVSYSGGNIRTIWKDNRDNEFNIYAGEVVDPVTDSPRANVPLIVTGTKQIGDNPIIYEYDNHNLWTDSSGELDLMLEWDPGYNFEINTASSTLNIIKREPIQPLGLLADTIESILIYVE